MLILAQPGDPTQPVGFSINMCPIKVIFDRTAGRIPHRLVHIEAGEPAIKNVVLRLLHQLPLAADGLSASSGTACSNFSGAIDGARLLSTSAQPVAKTFQRLVHHSPHHSKRMIRRNPLLRRPIDEHPALLLVPASDKSKTFVIVLSAVSHRHFSAAC